MKKVFLIVMLALTTALASTAQIIFISSVDGTTTDTLTNAGTVNFTSPANALVGMGNEYTIQFTNATISGTTTFKAILQGTIDGTNYTNLHGKAGTNGIMCDTLQVTANAPASFIFNAHPNAYSNAGKVKRVRIKVVGAGTQSTLLGPVQMFANKD